MEVLDQAVAGEYAGDVKDEGGRLKAEDGCRLHPSSFSLPPSEDAEALLWWKYRRTGKTHLRNEIVSLYQGWVIGRVRTFAYARGLDWADLWGAAVIALIEAIDRFDPSCGVPFFAFAARRVNGSLYEALRRDSVRHAFAREARRRRNRDGDGRDCRVGPPHPAVFRIEDGGGDDGDAFDPVHPVSREPDPYDAAAEEEILSRVLDSMKNSGGGSGGDGVSPERAGGSTELADVRLREIARRRFSLRESVDEIGLALGLGRTRVNELLRDECLPRARQACRRMGLAPPEECGRQVESA